MAHSIATMKYLLVIYCLILNFSEFEGAFSGIDGNCFDDEVAICKEVSRACQITYDASGSRDFECACQYPFLERNRDCIYDPESHHFKLKMELTNMYPLIDLNDVINYHRLKEDLKEWLKGMFPDATIHVTNIWKKRLSFTLLEEFSHIFKQTPKTKIYAEARLSQSGLSKHKIKQTLNIACSSVCKTEMFSLVSPAQNAEIESLDSIECSVCGPTHICNPRAATLCSCKDNSTDCLDMPIPLRFQTLEETDLGDEFLVPNLFSGFGRSEELGRALKGFPKTLPPCPRYHQKLCQLINGDCVPSLSKGLSCECMEKYVMSKTGTCTPINEIEDDVYGAQLLLRNDAPWSEDLADKTSYRYLRLKRNALRFLKVVFPDARTSVLGFAPSNRRQRDSTGSQVQMEIVLVSDTTEYDEETISIRLQAYQVDNEVTVPGIAFSVYTEVYSDPVEVESTSSTTSSTLTSTTLLSSTSTSTSSTTSSTLTSTTSASSTTSTTTTSPETPTSTSSTTPFTTTGTSSAPPSTSTLISTVTTSTSTPTTSPVTTTGPPTTSTHSSTSTSSSTSSTLTSTTPASSTTSTTTASPEPPTSTSSTTLSTTTGTSSTTPSTSTITSTITPSTSSTLTSTTPASSTTSTTAASPEPPTSTSSTTPSTTTGTSSTTPSTSTITSTITPSTSSTLTSTTPAPSTTSTTTASPEPPTSTSSTTPSTTTGTSSTTPSTSTITSTITPSTSSTLTSTTPALSTTSTTTASPEPPTSTSSTTTSTTTDTSSTTPTTSTITSTITTSTSTTFPITTTETTSTSSQSSTSTATTTVSTTTTSQPPEDPCLNNDCLSRNQKCVPLSASDYKCVCGFPAIEETEDSDVFCSIVPTYDPYGGRVVIQLNSERDLTSDFTTDYIALRSEIEGNFDNDLFAKISHVSYFGLLETVSDLTLTVVFYINVQSDGTNPADISGLLEDIESRLGQQLHSTSYTMDLSTLEITKSLITCSTLNICAAGLDKYALCSNNATSNITQCTCSKGFREQYSICQDDDDCKGNPCANYGDNDAVCNDFYGYFKCNCSTGFIYANDDGCVPDPTLKNPCSPDPCDSDKSKCVKALNEVGYECKCFFPFVRRPDGSCSKTKPGKDKVYNITIPLTSLTVWTDDLSDPNSLAFLKLKKDAEKFIKAIFKDAVGQIQGFSKRPAATGRFFPSIPSPYRQQKSQKTYAFVELSVFDDSDCTDCDDSHECISESSSKKCICKPGMEQVGVNGNIAICEDVNECKDRNPCASYGDFGSKCINHDGRFLKYLCDCSPGYKFGRGSCIDKEVLREEQI